VAKGENVLISPCDGKVTACPIGQDTTFLIKNTRYTVGQLLDSERLGKHYQGGYVLIIRLTVDDYHHYCYPADGRKSMNVFIPGKLHTVNPVANDLHPIYKENAREYTLIRTGNFGTIAMMEVGAMMVGKITNCHPGQGFVKKGEEKGYFEFGGSTVVLLLQPGKVTPDADLLENSEKGFETIIRMGEQIGECQLSEGTGKAD
jgi:phosphatidylserine decarboxylase